MADISLGLLYLHHPSPLSAAINPDCYGSCYIKCTRQFLPDALVWCQWLFLPAVSIPQHAPFPRLLALALFPSSSLFHLPILIRARFQFHHHSDLFVVLSQLVTAKLAQPPPCPATEPRLTGLSRPCTLFFPSWLSSTSSCPLSFWPSGLAFSSGALERFLLPSPLAALSDSSWPMYVSHVHLEQC